MSWYADRAVLAAIYQATELYWITDSSPAHRDTLAFLNARLQHAHSLRTSLWGTLNRVLTLSDAAAATASTVFRASRNAY